MMGSSLSGSKSERWLNLIKKEVWLSRSTIEEEGWFMLFID